MGAMKKFLGFTGLAGLVLSAGVVVAQGNRVTVQVNVGGPRATPELRVTPERARICLDGSNCPEQARWRAVGRRLAANERLEMRSKGEDCFSLGTFFLTRTTTAIDSGRPTTCGAGSEWGYDVVLLRDGAEVARLDPALVIDP